MAEPPILSRLKCAGHHHKGNTDTNALQMEQFLVCRVMSRYNHQISDRTSIPRTKSSPEISQPYILQHRHSIYYNKFKVLNTDPNLVKHYTRHKFQFRVQKQRKENTTATTRRKRYHSSGSLSAEYGSHSTDQLAGKEQGQDRLAI